MPPEEMEIEKGSDVVADDSLDFVAICASAHLKTHQA